MRSRPMANKLKRLVADLTLDKLMVQHWKANVPIDIGARRPSENLERPVQGREAYDTTRWHSGYQNAGLCILGVHRHATGLLGDNPPAPHPIDPISSRPVMYYG